MVSHPTVLVLGSDGSLGEMASLQFFGTVSRGGRGSGS